jgi:succinate dehydrogenase / fumarate reductase cytochrome b subunit
LTSLVLTLTETLRYRGAIGQWSWVLHRLSGLGVVLFITLHIIDTSWALFYPDLYVKAIAVYQTPLFTIGEFVLVACVIYHAINGMRISILDNRPHLWRYQQRAAWIVLGLSALLAVPVFVLMFSHVLNFYNNPERQVLPLSFVIESQLPFVVGIAAAVVAAIIMSGLHGLIAPGKPLAAGARPQGSRLEKFWWSYMRVSGLLILPLVFGHLAMMHVVQGVFDITAQGYTVVGTGGIVNETGTAVEFVAARWNLFIGPLAIWRLYDFGLLALVVVHGFNGLRYVLTDYTASSALLKRAGVYLCVIGAVVLLTVGTAALIGTIDETAIKMATEAMAKLYGGG